MVDENIINKNFTNNVIGHAYLLRTKQYKKVIDIVKNIFIQNNLKEPNIENLIEQGIFQDFKLIEPEGQWIKKEQILTLKEDFKTKSSYDNKRIYVIKNAENLNKSSANTLLKFLEEPEEDIIALLITENKNKVLETIVSRCQYINLDCNVEEQITNDSEIYDFIILLEKKRQKSSIDVLKYLERFNERKDLKNFFLKVINIYDKMMISMMGINNSKTLDNEEFDKIIKNNTIEDIKKRINGLIIIIDSLEFNINMKLLVDKLVISMFGVD